MPRLTQEQIDLHNTHLGGSGAAVALGFSKRMSARHLYHCMRGEMPWPEVDPVMTELGHAFEPVVTEWFEQNHAMEDGEPCSVIRRRKTYFHRRHPRLMCHPDGVLRRVKHILEVKLRGDAKGEDWGPSGTDVIPVDVMIQARHNMEVMRKEVCWVAVFFMMQREYRIYRIERDADLARDILKAEHTFFECIDNGTPPEWDFTHTDTADILKSMFPGTDGSVVTLPDEIWNYHQVLMDVKERQRSLEKLATEARNVIRLEMGHHAVGELPDGSSYVRARRRRGDTTFFALEHKRALRVHGENGP